MKQIFSQFFPFSNLTLIDTSAFPIVYTKGTSLVTQRLHPLTIWTTESKKTQLFSVKKLNLT